jgi:hypothetical protein
VHGSVRTATRRNCGSAVEVIERALLLAWTVVARMGLRASETHFEPIKRRGRISGASGGSVSP